MLRSLVLGGGARRAMSSAAKSRPLARDPSANGAKRATLGRPSKSPADSADSANSAQTGANSRSNNTNEPKRLNSSLRYSREAIKQSTQGIALDPANPVAPPVPILESIFDDAGIYDNDNLPSSFASPSTPLAASLHEIKGLSAAAVTQLFAQRVLLRATTKIHVPNVANLAYFPPSHPIAQYRKSRPALVVLRGPGPPFNGNPVPPSPLNLARKPLNPLDSATWRQKTARRFRAALWEVWENEPIDGVYVVVAFKVPTSDEARELMIRFVRTKVRLSGGARSKADKLDLRPIDQQLLRQHTDPPEMYLDEKMWEPKERAVKRLEK